MHANTHTHTCSHMLTCRLLFLSQSQSTSLLLCLAPPHSAGNVTVLVSNNGRDYSTHNLSDSSSSLTLAAAAFSFTAPETGAFSDRYVRMYLYFFVVLRIRVSTYCDVSVLMCTQSAAFFVHLHLRPARLVTGRCAIFKFLFSFVLNSTFILHLFCCLILFILRN
jgi:hypothetical protein